VAAIACNTAHVPRIFDKVSQLLHESGENIKLLNIVDETVKFIQRYHPRYRKIGVLSTTGSYKFRLYEHALEQAGLVPISIDEGMQSTHVHPAIYDTGYGIKSTSPIITDQAKARLFEAAGHLADQGAEAIILGCTEIPLAIVEKHINGGITIDPNKILARALILAFEPSKLKD